MRERERARARARENQSVVDDDDAITVAYFRAFILVVALVVVLYRLCRNVKRIIASLRARERERAGKKSNEHV